MEWVETTGRTVDEAKEAALDELGVDEVDAEFEVLAEPRPGLFGRLRSEARVRARVRPTAPRAKEDRRDRRRRSGSPAKSDAGGVATESPAPTAGVTTAQRAEDAAPSNDESPAAASGRTRSRRRGHGPARPESTNGTTGDRDDKDLEEEGAGVEVDLEKQGQVAEEFLTQLMSEFGVDASVAVTRPDDETVELQLTGSDLGILIGPKGATLVAIQNLVRNAVQHETGANNGHINVDVAGYRQRRTEALVRFAEQVASSVKQSGARTAMEPMSAVDRKVVHDTIAEIDGVSTVSEGEEPRRRVVVVPAAES
jgi:spoIIIJ-associated protein